MFLIQMILSLGCIQSAQAVPQNIVIDSKLFYQGQKISSPRITAVEGKKAIVSQTGLDGKKGFRIELVPTISKNNLIKMNYFIRVKELNNEIHSRGVVSLLGKQKGLIFLDKGKIKLQLQVNKS